MKFAIDLTWVRHKIVGGTESFVMNLMDGIMETKNENDVFAELCQHIRSHKFDTFE